MVCLLFPLVAWAWEGFDWESGNFVEIEPGSTVEPGETIEFYDWDDGEYKEGTVMDVRESGIDVEVDILVDEDDEEDEDRTFSMDKE